MKFNTTLKKTQKWEWKPEK